jgi:anthranilate synthase component I
MRNRHEYIPSHEEFIQKASEGNLIPVYREIMADLETPVTAFLKIREDPYSYLLESVEGGEKWARYSFLGNRPSLMIRAKGKRVEIIQEKGTQVITAQGDPLEVLKEVMGRYTPVSVQGLPRFFGGAVGYISYDTARFFERIQDHGKAGLDVPDLFFLITDTLLIFDNLTQKIKVVSNAYLDGSDPDKAYTGAIRKIESMISRLKKSIRKPVTQKKRPLRAVSRITSNLNKADYEKMVLRAKEYIYAGDIIQVVLSQRIETSIRSDPFDVYRALRVINPSPYMYYLQLGKIRLVGSSPEVMVRRENSQAELRPIAGTRSRGSHEVEDQALETELVHDEKEKAEHIMLVDLGRNDLGRVSKVGGVRVEQLMKVERYSHVMHLVSQVTGTLQEGHDSFDVMRACFPAGTVSGAPKIRAMEIIEELEPHKRGPYAGAVGYFSFSGNMDTCINIRTILIKGQHAYIQAGAGIVADSDPHLEYHETVSKAKAMLAAIELAEQGLE